MQRLFFVLSITGVLISTAGMKADAQYRLDRFVFGGGGLRVSGAANRIVGTFGQTVAGKCTAPAQGGLLGFWWSTARIPVLIDRPGGDMEATSLALLESYPHPVHGVVHLRLSSTTGAGVIRLSDLLGREVECITPVGVGTRTQEYTMDLSDVPPGVYLLTVDDGETHGPKSVIIVE